MPRHLLNIICSVCVCVWIWVCVRMWVHVCMRVCIWVYEHVCVCVFRCVHMYVGGRWCHSFGGHSPCWFCFGFLDLFFYCYVIPCMQVHAYMYIRVIHKGCECRGQKRCETAWDWNYRWFWGVMWVFEIKPGSPRRAASDLSGWSTRGFIFISEAGQQTPGICLSLAH